MSKYILIGAGQRGRSVIELLPYGLISEVMDSDDVKVGQIFCGFIIKKTSIIYIVENNARAILTFYDEIFINELKNNNIQYFVTFGRNENNIFMQKVIQEQLINDIWNRYNYDKRIKYNIFSEELVLFKDTPTSDFNRMLIESMKSSNLETMTDLLNSKDREQGNDMFPDEYYDYRVGMQISYKIIEDICKNRHITMLDIACGHGQFIIELNKLEKVVAEGIDSSESRTLYLAAQGMNVCKSLAENIQKSDKSYDVITCFECLEHVLNPKKVISEIVRLLKPNGLTIISVPYKKYCDDDTHVRYFTENNLYSLLNPFFEIINILIIPYVFGDPNNNIYVVAKKK